MDTYKHHTVAWQLLRSTPTGLESLSACSRKYGDGDEATQDWTRGGDETSPTPIRLQGCSTTLGNLPRLLLGWTRHLHQASFRSVSARLQVSRAAAFQHQALALWRSGQLVPQGWTPSTPGEQCRTQVPTSAGSGDLLPKLGEETAPPLVQDQRAASRRSWQRYKVLVIVVTKPLWYSAGLDDEFFLEVLATKPATKFLGAFVNSCYDNYSNWLLSAVSYTSMETVDDGYTYQNKVLAISHRGSATC